MKGLSELLRHGRYILPCCFITALFLSAWASKGKRKGVGSFYWSDSSARERCVVAPALAESLNVELLSDSGCFNVGFLIRVKFESSA